MLVNARRGSTTARRDARPKDPLLTEVSATFSGRSMGPCRLKCRSQIGGTQLRQRRRSPALFAPCIRDRGECLWQDGALELLLVGRELEVGSLAVLSECHVDARHLERRAVKMWDLGRPIEGPRHAPQIIRRGHD